MKQLQIDIYGISKFIGGDGYFQSEDYTAYYTGHEKTKKEPHFFIASKDTARIVQVVFHYQWQLESEFAVA